MTKTHPYYWVRTDFEYAMNMLSPLRGVDLKYPKTGEQAVAELQLRGIDVRPCAMERILDDLVFRFPELRELHPDPQTAQRERTHLDALADRFNSMNMWTPTAQLCSVLNLSYHQFIRSYWVAAALSGVSRPFEAQVDVSRLLIVVQPPTRDEHYARIVFFPKGTEVVLEAVAK